MKAQIIVQNLPIPFIHFPTVFEANGLCVLAFDNRSGIVIEPGTSAHKVGFYSNNWNNFTDSSLWKHRTDIKSITLSELNQ